MERLAGLKIAPRRLVRDTMQHAEHGIVFPENAANRCGGVNAQGLEFPQQEQPEDMVEIGVGQHHPGDWRLAHAVARMQFRRGFDLSAQIGRRAQQKPGAAIRRDRNLGLGARLAVEGAAPYSATVGAGTVPLGKRASGRGTENLDSHL
jgi:hypothetical protein